MDQSGHKIHQVAAPPPASDAGFRPLRLGEVLPPGVYSESWKFMNWLCSIMD